LTVPYITVQCLFHTVTQQEKDILKFCTIWMGLSPQPATDLQKSNYFFLTYSGTGTKFEIIIKMILILKSYCLYLCNESDVKIFLGLSIETLHLIMYTQNRTLTVL